MIYDKIKIDEIIERGIGMKLFAKANAYCKESNWKDLALLKFCLCAIGIIIGLLIPDAYFGIAMGVALLVFLITYIPLMWKFFKVKVDED